MAVSMLAGCFGGGGNKNYSDEAADAANAAQSTVVFATDTTLAKSLQDALADGLTQLDEIDDAMEADENLKPLLTSGWDLDIFAAQGEDAEAAAKTIAEQYIVSAVIGKKAEGKIAMVLHDGNGYYYVAVLTYGGGSGSGGGTGGGSGSGDDHRPGGGDDDHKPGGGDDDDENSMYDVTVTWNGNGTVTINGESCENGESVSLRSGTKVTIVANDSEDYVFSNWTGVPAGAMQNGNECIISSLDSDLEIVAVYNEKAPDASTVTFTVTGEGTVINTVTNKEIKDGDTFEMVPADKMNFTVTSDDGWKIAEVSGANVTPNGNGSYTLSNVTENTTVTVTFEEIVYKVSPSRILNGRVVVNPSVVYPSRGEDSVTITLHPNVGYELGSIEDIEVSVGNVVAKPGTDNQYIWSGITKDATVDVEFKKSEYTVNVYGSYWNYGSVTVGGKTIANNSNHSVESGEDFTFTVKANTTGEIASVKVDGTKVELNTDGSYTIKNVTANHTVEVNFKAKTFSVTVDSTTNGTVGLKGVDSNNEIAAGEDLTIIPTPNKGFEVDKVTVNGNDVDPSSDGKYVVNNVQEDLTVSVTFKRLTYTVKVVTEGGDNSCTVAPTEGTVSVDKPNFEFTVTVSEDYSAQPVVTSGSAYVVAGHDGKSYTVVTDVTGDVTVTVNFVKKQPVVTGIHAEPDNIICYVGQTFKKSALTVYADYSDGDSLKLDSDDYTITGISEGVLTEAETYNVTIKYNVDSSMTDVVTVIVKQPTVEKIELIVPEDEKFDIGDSLFWDNKLLVSTFREGFQIKITYKESGIEPKYVEIEQSMLSGKIKATYEGVFGGTNDLGFVKAGNQDVQVKYYDTDSLKWYTTTVNVNVTVTGGRD